MKNKNLILLAGVVAFIVLAYAAYYSTQKSGAEVVNSGVSGNVTYGPVTPVCREGEECYKPYVGALSVKTEDNREVAQVSTDVNGGFRVRLRPGTYLIQIEQDFIRVCGTTVTVEPGKFTETELNCDTGIR